MRLVVNACPGRIVEADICQFSGKVCGGFEAGASRGYLVASLVNTGRLNASYTLTVRMPTLAPLLQPILSSVVFNGLYPSISTCTQFSNCSIDIMPVEARQVWGGG